MCLIEDLFEQTNWNVENNKKKKAEWNLVHPIRCEFVVEKMFTAATVLFACLFLPLFMSLANLLVSRVHQWEQNRSFFDCKHSRFNETIVVVERKAEHCVSFLAWFFALNVYHSYSTYANRGWVAVKKIWTKMQKNKVSIIR